MVYLACQVFTIYNLAHSLSPVVQLCYTNHRVTVSHTSGRGLSIVQSGQSSNYTMSWYLASYKELCKCKESLG